MLTTLDDWVGIVLKMEKLTYQLKIEKNKLYQIWNKLIHFLLFIWQ